MVPPASQRMLDVRIGRQAQMRGTLGREQGCVNIVGTIRPVEARELAAEADSYDAGLRSCTRWFRRAGSCSP